MKVISNEKQCRQLVYKQYCKQEEYKKYKKQFEEDKEECETQVLNYLGSVGKKRLSFGVKNNAGVVEDVITATMVEATKIVWYPDKLKKRIPKPIARQVIKKKYQIADMKGLSEYLKECGVDPQTFAKYLSIEEEVDQDAIERLGELGKITPKNISGCYIVQCSKPYLKLTKKKEKQNDGEWEE